MMVLLALASCFVLIRLGWLYWDRAHPGPEPKRKERVAGIPPELDTLDLKILNFYTFCSIFHTGF